MSDQIVRPCLLCGKQVTLNSLTPSFARALRDPGYRPVCDACGQLTQNEAVASSGINPQLLDPMDYLLKKKPESHK